MDLMWSWPRFIFMTLPPFATSTVIYDYRPSFITLKPDVQYLRWCLNYASFFAKLYLHLIRCCFSSPFTVYNEVENRISSFRQMLFDKLMSMPSTLEEQKKLIRFRSTFCFPSNRPNGTGKICPPNKKKHMYINLYPLSINDSFSFWWHNYWF